MKRKLIEAGLLVALLVGFTGLMVWQFPAPVEREYKYIDPVVARAEAARLAERSAIAASAAKPVEKKIGPSRSITKMGSQIFNTPGSGTWTPGFTGTVKFLAVGGGGGGDDAGSMTGAGGGGGSIYRTGYPVTSGVGISYVVGAGGSVRGNGGSTTFDGLTATGGTGATSVTGGAGGTGDFSGGTGGSGDSATHGGGGGGGASTANGSNGASGASGGAGGSGGSGSSPIIAGGVGGNGGALSVSATNGTAPGGGGGGYGAVSGAAGTGGNGYIQIEWTDFADAVGNNARINVLQEDLTMHKNVSGQKIGCQLINAADGSAFTGSATCYVTGDAGTQAAGSVSSGACTHEGNGYHTYAPAQAETNYDLIAFTFTGTGAIPATVQTFTSVDTNATVVGTVDASLTKILGTSLTETSAGYLAAAFKKFLDVATPVFTAASVNQTGDSYAKVDTEIADIQSRLPAALVGGRMDSSVGAMASNTLTAAALATDAVTEIQSGLATPGSAVNVTQINGTSIAGTGTRVADSFVTLLNVATPVLTVASVNQTGDSYVKVDTEVATIVSGVADIQSRLPSALVSGRMDSSVGAMASNTLTAAALATDAVTEIQSGLATSAEVAAGDVVICRYGAAFTSSAGTTLRASAWLERNGQLVVLPSGSCTIAFRENAAGSDLFTMTDAAPNAQGIFEMSQASPGFTSDRLQIATVTIVDDNSDTWVTAGPALIR